MAVFTLHAQLAQDTYVVGRFELCQVLLMDDRLYPWVILVPQRANIREVYELSPQEQSILIQESSFLAQQMALKFSADKLNIATLGNIVPQLHLHHIVRFRNDAAWPTPVWGKHPRLPYSAQAAATRVQELQSLLHSKLLT
ncbi:MAG: HIT family protein [Gammaproteobacteria bacterium]|nr:HIT family protein [Gammaproteobacteria bacterium]